MAVFLQPSNYWTFAFCFVGGFLIFSVGYGISYLQITYIGKNETVRSIFSPEKRDNEKKKKDEKSQ